MSHQLAFTSSPNTPLSERTVGELVAERPGRSRVFQFHQIDFCCQGGRTLRAACQLRGVPLDAVVTGLTAEASNPTAAVPNPAELPPAELAAYLVETHHEYLRRELPRLHGMAERVARVHGGHTPSLIEVLEVFLGLEAELTTHLLKEERILFPAIAGMANSGPVPGLLDGPIACMLHEHDDAGAAMKRLRELTAGYQPPAEACNTYRALFAGLQELEVDLHRHIHLENSVLFPAAQALACG
ncbi:MAG: iron-sulfur cluster repair di-iron protein [Verrucomicrobiales bacterium]|nr:iron-sulfur cluster repair di-iron protein [Verrucomicrobiales bacterium]